MKQARTRRPSIVGAAQTTQRVDDPADALEPIALMEHALRAAAEDAGAPKLLEALDTILVPHGTWKYGDPGALLAERVGASGVETGVGAVSGHIVQVMLDWACTEIAAGRRDVIALVGGESQHSRRRLKRRGIEAPWGEPPPGEPDRRFGSFDFAFDRQELAAGIVKPSVCFALCENALGAHRGRTPAEHRRHIARLSARMAAVAADNPHAWIRRAVPAEEIAAPTPGNRMVTYPYTKLMTANIAVDQAGALILCSEEAAHRFGVPHDRHVHLRAATEMSHETLLSRREQLHEHPGMRIAARRVLEIAETTPEALAHVDLYSCFPFAVEAGAEALGLDEARPLSVTGGLTFSGGPFGNYVLQAKARMVELLRAQPGALGLVSSVGGNFAKFAFGVYSTEPGEAVAPPIEDVSEACAALPLRNAVLEHAGPLRVESHCVDVGHDGPLHATLCALADDGTRVWARSEDRALMDAILADEEICGRGARLREGRFEIA